MKNGTKPNDAAFPDDEQTRRSSHCYRADLGGRLPIVYNGKPAEEWYTLYCQEVLQHKIKPTDDTEGSPVGWTIEAIGRDGSILCRSPNGKRRRYQIECQLDGLGD